MNMAKEYFSFVFSNIESDMNVYLLDTQLGDYYSGEFSTNETLKIKIFPINWLAATLLLTEVFNVA